MSALYCLLIFTLHFSFSFLSDCKHFMMPELASRSSLEVEPETMFAKLENEFEIISASISSSNNDCDDYKNRSYNCNTNPNLQSVSFDESIADRPSSVEEPNEAIIDIISDYQDSDIELMQEALLVLSDDDDQEEEEEEFFSADRCDHHDKFTAMKNQFKKEHSDSSLFPIQPIHQNHLGRRETNYLLTADQDNNTIRDVESENSIDLHPLLLPQVTFDEEEKFDGRNFFNQEEALHQRSENKPDIPIVSPQPSQWLLQQLNLDDLSFQQSLGDMCMDGTTKKRNGRGINTGGIRASLETKHKHWSGEEDKTLKLAVETEQLEPIDWIKIARNYFNNTRSATQCKNRWKNVSNSYFFFEVFPIEILYSPQFIHYAVFETWCNSWELAETRGRNYRLHGFSRL